MNFAVCYAGIRVKVKLLPTIKDVHRAYRHGPRLIVGHTVHAFYAPVKRKCKFDGTIILPADGNLIELVAHEVVHAVMWKIGTWVHCNGDEKLADAVGVLTARILARIRKTNRFDRATK